MGLFNSVYFKCPHCGEELDEQFKPGYMQSYKFPEDVDDMPIEYAQYFSDTWHTCYNCNNKFYTNVDVKISIENPVIKKTKEEL